MEFKKSPRITPRTKAASAQPLGTMPVRETTTKQTPLPSPAVPLQKTKPPYRRVSPKKIAIIIGILAALGITYVVIQSILNTTNSTKAILDPGYATVLPSGKSINDLGGWRRVSPPEKDPVYAYADTLEGVAISVSQQPLPKNFAANTKEHVADLAKKFNATTEVEASGTTVYIGTSAKGPQSVIFAKKDVLILIKSQQKIDTKAWQRYASALNGNRY